jgi:hypothetical protein
VSWIEVRRTGPNILGRHEADACLNPYGPGGQAVYEQQREVGDGGAAVPLDFPRPTAAAHRSRGG